MGQEGEWDIYTITMEMVKFCMTICFTLEDSSKKNNGQAKRKSDKLLPQLDLGQQIMFLN